VLGLLVLAAGGFVATNQPARERVVGWFGGSKPAGEA
jgi:hypothetical protein